MRHHSQPLSLSPQTEIDTAKMEPSSSTQQHDFSEQPTTSSPRTPPRAPRRPATNPTRRALYTNGYISPSFSPHYSPNRLSVDAPAFANKKDGERAYICLAIAIVRDKWNIPIVGDPRKNFSREFCNHVRSLLASPSFAGTIRRKTKNPDGLSPTDMTIRNNWLALRDNGTTARIQQGGRPKDMIKRRRVEAIMRQGLDLTLKETAAKAQVSPTLVSAMMVEQGKRWYKPRRGQLLTGEASEIRHQFAIEMHDKIAKKEFDPHNCCFTDEAYFGTNVSKNPRNCGYWRPKGDFFDQAQKMITTKTYQTKVMVFVLVHSEFTIGPYFTEELVDMSEKDKNLTAKRYLQLIEDYIIPEVKERLGDRFEQCWWQQDGAPCHTSEIPMRFLRKTFGQRLIAKARKSSKQYLNLIWPPYSPDLNPLDFFFWSAIRNALAKNRPSTRQELKQALERVVHQIDRRHIYNAIDDFAIRVEALIENGGKHFELNLRKFKIERNERGEWCDNCNDSHFCECTACKLICLHNQLRITEETPEEFGLALLEEEVQEPADDQNPNQGEDQDDISELGDDDLRDLDDEERDLVVIDPDAAMEMEWTCGNSPPDNDVNMSVEMVSDEFW